MRLTPEQLERLDHLAILDGRLRVSAIVEDARDPMSPLHSCFVWDVDAAAHEHWKTIARKIVEARQLVRVKMLGPISVDAPFYVKDTSVASTVEGYVVLSSLRGKEVQARETVRQELLRVHALLTRALGVAAVLDLEDGLVGVLAAVGGLLATLDAADVTHHAA